MRSPEERDADDWWESLSPSRRSQVHQWIAQRTSRSTDDPDAYDALIELPAVLPASRAASAQYDVACRTCHAEPRQPCRTRTTGRVTDTHVQRIEDATARLREALTA